MAPKTNTLLLRRLVEYLLALNTVLYNGFRSAEMPKRLKDCHTKWRNVFKSTKDWMLRNFSRSGKFKPLDDERQLHRLLQSALARHKALLEAAELYTGAITPDSDQDTYMADSSPSNAGVSADQLVKDLHQGTGLLTQLNAELHKIARPPRGPPKADVQPALSELWSACENAATTMVQSCDQERAEHAKLLQIHKRLKIWGSGLFSEGDLHLDRLYNSSSSFANLAIPLQMLFIEIAYHQVYIMLDWLNAGMEDFLPLDGAIARIYDVVMAEKAQGFTLPLWNDLVTLEEIEARFEDPEVFNVKTRVNAVCDRLGPLDAYLPMIIRMARMRCLDLEHERGGQSALEEVQWRKLLTDDEPEPLGPSVGMAELLIDENRENVKNLEDLFAKQESVSPKDKTAFKDELESLEAWIAQRDQLTFTTVVEREIFETQYELHKQLKETFSKLPAKSSIPPFVDTLIPSDSDPSATMSSVSDPSTSTLGNARQSGSSSQTMQAKSVPQIGAEEFNDVLISLRIATKHLWFATRHHWFVTT